MEKEYAALGLGEVMMRLSPVGAERIAQGDQFVKHAGGSELNVVSGISRLGLRCGLISKLPANLAGRYIRNHIRSYGVSDDYVLDDADPASRLGIYYYEGGGYPRKPQVVYDRAHSAFTTITPNEIPADIYGKTRLFHTSGITLALCAGTRQTAVKLIEGFKKAGALISFDVNYRATLWSEAEAREVITGILPYVDILFVSEETCRRMLQKTGSLEEIQKSFHQSYGTSVVASTMRTVNSPRSHNFTSLLYAAASGTHYTEAPYQNIEVVDRIGSGDAYVAGVLYALLRGLPPEEAMRYGNAVSAIKNTIPGDLVTTDLAEVESVMADHAAGGAQSEMNR